MTVYPVLQAFEKDQNKIIFAINQLSRGLSGGGGGVPANMREPLTANRTYFVATTGSDSNDGLTSGAPFLTVQRAVNAAYGEIDLKGFNVTIQLANGTYTGAISVLFPQIGAGKITINGNAASPSSTILTASTVTVTVQRFSTLLLANLQVQSTAQYCLFASQSGLILGDTAYTPGTIVFGAATQGHMFGGTNGMVDMLSAPVQIVGNAARFAYASNNGVVRFAFSAITLPSARTFTTFAQASNLSYILAELVTFSGAGAGTGSTGTRYNASYNSVIATNGGIIFPGTVAGTTSFGGQFN